LVKETKNLDTKKLLEQLKEHSKLQLQTYIDEHPEFREDSEQDHNKIDNLLFWGYTLKILKIIFLLFNISFYVGMFFLLFCEYQMKLEDLGSTEEEFFLYHYNIWNE